MVQAEDHETFKHQTSCGLEANPIVAGRRPRRRRCYGPWRNLVTARKISRLGLTTAARFCTKRPNSWGLIVGQLQPGWLTKMTSEQRLTTGPESGPDGAREVAYYGPNGDADQAYDSPIKAQEEAQLGPSVGPIWPESEPLMGPYGNPFMTLLGVQLSE